MSQREVINPGFPGWEERYTFSPGVVKRGKTLWISGTMATDDHGKMLGVGDIVEQTLVIFEKIKGIVEAAGGSMDDIVMTHDYITTTENYRATAEVRRQYFTRNFPAATGVIVAGLLRPDALIEIDAVAVLSDE
ncbi:MAG: RidA family protein [Candidatus Tectomicrobia bacterium]|nr:RidA family protein [Candidatus Tectomicrobia bacterium]